jgi:hypothetical protein
MKKAMFYFLTLARIIELQKKIILLDEQLHDNSLYDDSTKKITLNQLIEARATAQEELEQLEDKWIELSMNLES